MLSAALLLLCNSLFLSLHLTGSAGSFPKPLSAARERVPGALCRRRFGGPEYTGGAQSAPGGPHHQEVLHAVH